MPLSSTTAASITASPRSSPWTRRVPPIATCWSSHSAANRRQREQSREEQLRRIGGRGGDSPRVRGLAIASAALAVAGGAGAQAQPEAQSAATSVYDGIYVGVSAVNNSAGNTLGGGRGRTEGYAGSRACRD